MKNPTDRFAPGQQMRSSIIARAKDTVRCLSQVASKYSKPTKGRSAIRHRIKPTNKELDQQQTFHFGEHGHLKALQGTKQHQELATKIRSFDGLKILPDVRAAIRQVIAQESIVDFSKHDMVPNKKNPKILEIDVRPTPIQVLTIHRLSYKLRSTGLHVTSLASETGSGKSIAYLTPLVDYLKREEIENPELWDQICDKPMIRGLIMVPTHELVNQVYGTVKKLGEQLNLTTAKWDSGDSHQEFLKSAGGSRIDILVTTPGKIRSLPKIRLLNRPDLILRGTRFVIFDEADTLLDNSWVYDTQQVLKMIPNVNHLIFCSATISTNFHQTLTKLFPNVELITTARLHKIPKTIEFKLVNASLNPFKGSKIKALAQVLYAIHHDGTDRGMEKRCVIFVNEKSDVDQLVSTLNEKYGHHAVGLTGANTPEERADVVRKFTEKPQRVDTLSDERVKTMKTLKIPGSNIVIDEEMSSISEKDPLQAYHVLVTTDLLARGLNFQNVRNVILYDVPYTSMDLVHRVGRTGRIGQSGRVFMIITNKTKAAARALPKIVKNNRTIS